MDEIHLDALYSQEPIAGGSRPVDESSSTRRRQERMIANGWCSHQAERLSKNYSSETFSALSRLKCSPIRVADHKRCEDHSACVAYNTDQKTYRTRHTTESCDCRMVMTPYKRLIITLRLGHIPLLSIETVNGKNELRVHRRHSSSRYVAISHVWFDGLGNLSQCALPNCWIDELKVRLDVLESAMLGARRQKRRKGPLLFWMDTLCIPVDEKHLALRLMQIDKMASIYKGATSSLVLDAELMELKLYPAVSSDTGIMEPELDSAMCPVGYKGRKIRERIACSVWMSRCWTYQEWQLPPTIAIQLKDSAIIMGHIDGRYQELITKYCLPAAVKKLTATALLPSIRNPSLGATENSSDASLTGNSDEWNWISSDSRFEFSPRKQLDLITAWNGLCGRSTTMTTDVPFILTNVQDYASLPLIQCKSAGEMLQLFFISQDWIPLSLFFNMGPRLHDGKYPRNRWIPTEISSHIVTSRNDCERMPFGKYLLIHSHNMDQSVSLYQTSQRLHFRSGDLLKLGTDAMYAVELSEADEDFPESDFEDFPYTCVIVRNGESGIRSGACFYHRLCYDGFWHQFSGRADYDLVYRRPLRLRPTTGLACLPGDGQRVLQVDRMRFSHGLHIVYGMQFCAEEHEHRLFDHGH